MAVFSNFAGERSDEFNKVLIVFICVIRSFKLFLINYVISLLCVCDYGSIWWWYIFCIQGLCLRDAWLNELRVDDRIMSSAVIKFWIQHFLEL